MPTAEVKAKLFSDRIERIQISATMAVVMEAAKLREQGADLVDFGAGEPHFATPEHIKEAAIAAIRANFSKYTPVAGTSELRAAIVERHAADFGSAYKPAECIASTGGKLALFNAIQVLVDHGDEVILPVPYWVSFKDIIEYAGGKCVDVDADESNGFALAPAPIVTAMIKLQSQSTSNPTSLVQKAAVEALRGPQQCIGEMRADYIKLRDKVVSGLREISGVRCTKPEGAFYAYPNVSA